MPWFETLNLENCWKGQPLVYKVHLGETELCQCFIELGIYKKRFFNQKYLYLNVISDQSLLTCPTCDHFVTRKIERNPVGASILRIN